MDSGVKMFLRQTTIYTNSTAKLLSVNMKIADWIVRRQIIELSTQQKNLHQLAKGTYFFI